MKYTYFKLFDRHEVKPRLPPVMTASATRAAIAPQLESRGFNMTGGRGRSDCPPGNLQKLAGPPLQMWSVGLNLSQPQEML